MHCLVRTCLKRCAWNTPCCRNNGLCPCKDEEKSGGHLSRSALRPRCSTHGTPRSEAGVSREGAGLLSRVGIVGRVGLMLFMTAILPMAVPSCCSRRAWWTTPGPCSALALALGLGLLAPVSRVCASIVVLGDLRALNRFCSEIRQGRYGTRLSVGLEGDGELTRCCASNAT